MRTKIILVLAIIMGCVTTYLFYDYIKKYEAETTISENMVAVLVAQDAIKKNQKITADMVGKIQVPQLGLHQQVVTEMSQIEGKFATADIEPGETILAHRVKDEKDESLLVARKVQKGNRAVSIGVNFVQSVSNLIEPEDYVDVIFTKTEKNIDQDVVKSEIILEHVRVLAVGRKMLEPTSEEAYVEYSSVTLELTPKDAVTLVNSSQEGQINLILHSRLIEGNAEVNNK